MKKLIALVMALAIIASFAACGSKEEETETTTIPTTEQVVEDATGEETEEQTTIGSAVLEAPEITDTTAAVDILDYIWMAMGAEHQPASYGGHFSEEYTGGPATYDLTYAEDLAATLLLPEDRMDAVTDAATVVHMLNANTMTAGLVRLHEGADVEGFAQAVADRIMNNRWMCGFPEKMVITQIDEEYLFIAYGAAEMLNPMANGMGASWTVNELYNQPLE